MTKLVDWRRPGVALGWLVVGLCGSCHSPTCARDCPSGYECVAAAGACLVPCVDDQVCPDGQICVDQYCARGNRRHLGDDGAPGGDGHWPEGDDDSCPTIVLPNLVIRNRLDMVPFQGLGCFVLSGSLTIEQTFTR